MKMSIVINNKILKLIILFILLLNFISLKSQEIIGDWKFKNQYIDVELFLNQNGNIITGNHCIVYGQNGDYLDCSDEGNITLKGTLKNNIVSLTITSEYSGNNGKINLEILSSNSLKWRLIKVPDGVFFYPDEAILVRESSLPMSALKEEELTPKPEPSSELEEESEPLLKRGFKLSDYDRGYFDGGLAYQQCKEEQDKEDRDIFDRYRRMPIEGMEWESKAPKLGLGDCREEAFERIKMSTKEYQDGFEKGWRDASMPLNKEKETTKKK